MLFFPKTPNWSASPPSPSALQIVRFQLTANLPLGGHASANPLIYGPSALADPDLVNADDYQKMTSITIQVWDVRKRNYGISGTRGFALFMIDSQRWEIIDFWHSARWITFTLNADLDPGTTAADVTIVDSWDGSQITGVVNAKTDGIDYSGPANAVGIATQKDNGNWLIVQLSCTVP